MSVEKSPNQWKLPAWVAFTLGGLALMTYGIFREHQARELTESRVDIIPPTKSAQLAMMKTNLSGVSINPTDVNTGIIVAGWLATGAGLSLSYNAYLLRRRHSLHN